MAIGFLKIRSYWKTIFTFRIGLIYDASVSRKINKHSLSRLQNSADRMSLKNEWNQAIVHISLFSVGIGTCWDLPT